MNNVKKHRKAGFVIIESIVGIAIAVSLIVAVPPVAISQVEVSNIKKDEQAANKLVMSIESAITNENILNEVSEYVPEDGKMVPSCYRDQRPWEKDSSAKYFLDSEKEWYYEDEARQNDKELYLPDGEMKGFTLSFKSVKNKDGDYEIIFKNAIINGLGDVSKDISQGIGTLSNQKDKPPQKEGGLLLSYIEKNIGEKVLIESKKYRNSVFTVFIKTGVKNNKFVIEKIYGQWNGSNLTKEQQHLDLLTM